VFEHGQVHTSRHLIRRLDGQEKLVETVFAPVRNHQGEITHVVESIRDLSELHQTWEHLGRVELRYQELVDHINTAVAMFRAIDGGEDFIIEDFNLAAASIERVAKEDVIGRRVTEAFPGVVEFGLLEVFRRVYRTGQPEEHPIRFYQDGRISGWRENFVYRLPSLAVVTVYEDRTNQKQAEEALSASQARFHALFTTMQEGVCLHEIVQDPTGKAVNYRILDVNPAYEKLTSLKRLDVVGKIATVVYGTEEPPYLEIYEEVARTGNPVTFETYFAPWEKHFFVSVFSPERDLFATAFFDISDRIKAENELRESELKYRTLVEMFSHPIVIIQEGWFVFANQTARSMMSRGVGEAELMEEIRQLISAEEYHKVEAYLLDLLTDGEQPPRQYEIEVTKPKGERAVFEVFVEQISFRGSPAVQAIAMDITDRKRDEEARLHLETQMMQAQKLESLGVLAGGIAHDFNNLLMGVLGHADLAMLALPRGTSAMQSIREIERAARQAAELCKQMLAYSGKGRFVVEPVDLRRLVEEMAHLLKVSISKAAVLKFDFAAELPAIEADSSQIRQVVMNLIINASEALEGRNGVVSVSTGVMDCDHSYFSETYLAHDLREGEYVYLEVSDSGSGMDDKTRARIFDPFYTTKFTGRGLGLAAVLGIVRGHRGAIKVYSEVGKGTTFKVFFPATNVVATKPSRPPEVQQWQGQGTILVIDDEPSARTVTRLFLEKAGFTVLLAENGQVGLDVFEEHADEISAVILDLTMPKMGGEETFRELRRVRAEVKVILSSGYNEMEVTRRFVGQGLAGFIQKPYKYTVLIEKLQEIL
jgi:PAS domain S-box-containing protein